MTKELENYLIERNIPVTSLEANSIQEGYDLAIKKACEWLYHNTSKHIDDKYLTMHFNLTSEMIEDFRKVMEG